MPVLDRGPFCFPPLPPSGRRYVGAVVPLRSEDLAIRTHNWQAFSPEQYTIDAIQRMADAGWTAAVLRTWAGRSLDVPRRPALPLVLFLSAYQSQPLYAQVKMLPAFLRGRPLAVMSAAHLHPTLEVRVPHVWRVREVLPPSTGAHAERTGRTHGYALTEPDPKALDDPRLQCWAVPLLTEESPQLGAWLAVLRERPEVPVMIMGSPRRAIEVLQTRLLLWPALNSGPGGE